VNVFGVVNYTSSAPWLAGRINARKNRIDLIIQRIGHCGGTH
jgi:hypothetical protein